MNKQNGTAIISEEEHIKQSVSDILLTQIGTRIQRRDYGSNIPKLIDRPINGALMLQIAACAVVALNCWEPRIYIRQFKPRFIEGKICANIIMIRTDTHQEINYDNLLLGVK
ncbi:baseplate assembly protein W [Actinobacillus seminis]|uniref:Baseplate assembly protein W n=1 Tax=Actinobacillus seminis TaxID=722 RepID=A0A263HFK3_9PAST|nr:GPW/gp25 family protein [Actinobacillus seminis]OZN25346.1 baseplate assembly protein W [Actinobacillus seminis]SUU35707.1 Gene 25-like lysozyme [Actinobacillus seminis]